MTAHLRLVPPAAGSAPAPAPPRALDVDDVVGLLRQLVLERPGDRLHAPAPHRLRVVR